jgi:hypothetical protein
VIALSGIGTAIFANVIIKTFESTAKVSRRSIFNLLCRFIKEIIRGSEVAFGSATTLCIPACRIAFTCLCASSVVASVYRWNFHQVVLLLSIVFRNNYLNGAVARREVAIADWELLIQGVRASQIKGAICTPVALDVTTELGTPHRVKFLLLIEFIEFLRVVANRSIGIVCT